MPATVQPIEQAALLYAERGASLAVVLEAYLHNPLGYVVKRPDLFLLARPCRLAEPDRWLSRRDPQEAWYVQFAADDRGSSHGQSLRAALGLAARCLREMPYVLPHCCWHREWRDDGLRLHTYATARLLTFAR